MKDRWRALALIGVAISAGMAVGNPVAQAKRKASYITGFKVQGWAEQYAVKKGPIYKTDSITKKLKTKQHIFYSDTTITVVKPSGKHATYRELVKKSGKTIGYVAVKKAKVIKDSDPRSDASKKRAKVNAKKQAAEKKNLTASERADVAKYRKEAKAIGNGTKGMYAQKPVVKGHFSAGKLSSSYINRTVKWINFYRDMYGLNDIKADAAWNTEAQYGAAALAAVDKGLSHGLVKFTRPSFISEADWQRGAKATNSSNLSAGCVRPGDNVLIYMGDSGNPVPGHREWLLGGISQIGIGQAGDYSDYKVFGGYTYADTPKTIAYPKAGAFPVQAANEGSWSYSFDTEMPKNAAKPDVSVYDNTTHKSMKVKDVGLDDGNYGGFGTTVHYWPGTVKVNHSYTVSIKNMPNHPDVTYTTKLFKLAID